MNSRKLGLFFIFIISIWKLCGAFSKEAVDEKGKESDKTLNAVYNAIVDINGSGDYASLQEAINQVPEGRTSPWTIFIMNGRYEELVRIPKEKRFIHLIGQDVDSVVITYKINCANPENYEDAGRAFSKVHFEQNDCATVVVEAPDFYAEHISFENSWGVESQSGPQALAMKLTNDRAAFYHCRFRSFQDTWMTSTKGVNDRTYANQCWIEGAVDYFYGGGNAYIENSTFYNVRSGSVIVAPSQAEGTKYGYVFNHCVVDGNSKAADGRLKLGRPWHNQPLAVYLYTTFKIPVDPEGWTDMGPSAKLFAEYQSKDVEGRPLDLSQRRTWYQQNEREGGKRITGLSAILTDDQVTSFSYENVIQGTGGWNPRSFFEEDGEISNVKVDKGMIYWKGIAGARGYAIFFKGKVLGFSSSTNFKFKEQTDSDIEKLKIYPINQYGSLVGRHHSPLDAIK